MIITRTPFRLSFFGGGTDYPAWFREHGGAVLATALNKYCYISCRHLPPFFPHKSRIVWSQIELVRDRAEIRHPAVREVLEFLGIGDGVELHHDGDLPARTGIGSSSAFTVGLLHALYALRGEMVTKARLAQDAILVEQERLREAVGCQDQVMAAYGGFNRVEFRPDGSFEVAPLVLPAARAAELERHLMLVFTGFARDASEVAREQVRLTPERGAELRALRDMVDEAVEILTGKDDLARFGRLLDASWRIKRALTSVISTAAIDDLYAAARDAGALGGKLLGAGGGGFFVLFVAPEARARVRRRLGHLLEVPFAFERTGSQVVVYEPDPRP